MWIGLAITSILINIIAIYYCCQVYNEYKNVLGKDKIYNLFYEIYVFSDETNRYSYRTTYYYKGRIKTLYPNGKEKVIWTSENKYLDKHKCEEDTKLRYKFLCEFYGQKYIEETNDTNTTKI